MDTPSQFGSPLLAVIAPALHAKIVYTPATRTFYLEAAASRNGTFLGSDRLNGRVPLQPGTLFRVGRTWLRVDPPRSAPEETNLDEE